jgi:hypothetical protein
LARQVQPITEEVRAGMMRTGEQRGMDRTIQEILEPTGEHRGELGVVGEGRGGLGENLLLVSGETSGISQQPEFRDIRETTLEEAEVQTKTTKKQLFRVNSKKNFPFNYNKSKNYFIFKQFFLNKSHKKIFFFIRDCYSIQRRNDFSSTSS